MPDPASRTAARAVSSFRAGGAAAGLGQRQLGLGRTAGHDLASRRRQRKRAIDVVGGAQESAPTAASTHRSIFFGSSAEGGRCRKVLQRPRAGPRGSRRAWRRPSVCRTARRRAPRRTGSSDEQQLTPSSARRRAQLPQWPHRTGAPASPKYRGAPRADTRSSRRRRSCGELCGRARASSRCSGSSGARAQEVRLVVLLLDEVLARADVHVVPEERRLRGPSVAPARPISW